MRVDLFCLRQKFYVFILNSELLKYSIRDTPHHLKNKRVQQSVDKGSNAILTNAMKFREKTPPLTQQTGLPPVSAAAAREEHAQLEAIKSGDEEASPSQEGKSKFYFF